MRRPSLSVVAVLCTLMSGVAAEAACTGSNGRGWGRGQGEGAWEMAPGDKTCNINFPGFINEAQKTRVPATETALTRPPASGKIGIVPGQFIVYTPNPGFKGRDQFCTRNTAPGQSGTLSGCITVTVR